MNAPRYPGDLGRLPHPVRSVRDPLQTGPAPFITRRAGPVLGGPLYRPAARERRAWTLLEVLGAASLSGTWLLIFWTVIEGL